MNSSRIVAPVVVMGVSGSGKSTVGAALARAVGAEFVDADSLHPGSNIDKMRAGVPLTDTDRWPWLDRVAGVLAGGHVVVACSVLRRIYRDRLREAAPDLVLVYLEADFELLHRRMRARQHFMPASLLGSQLEALEAPEPDEGALWVDASTDVPVIVDTVVSAAQLSTACQGVSRD